MKNKEILTLTKQLTEIKDKNLGKSIKFQYAVLTNLRKVFTLKSELIEESKVSRLKQFESDKQELTIKYALKDDSGKAIVSQNENGQFVTIPEDNKPLLNKEMIELFEKYSGTLNEVELFLNTNDEFEVHDIDVGDCEGIDIKTMDAIYPLLKE